MTWRRNNWKGIVYISQIRHYHTCHINLSCSLAPVPSPPHPNRLYRSCLGSKPIEQPPSTDKIYCSQQQFRALLARQLGLHRRSVRGFINGKKMIWEQVVATGRGRQRLGKQSRNQLTLNKGGSIMFLRAIQLPSWLLFSKTRKRPHTRVHYHK